MRKSTKKYSSQSKGAKRWGPTFGSNLLKKDKLASILGASI